MSKGTVCKVIILGRLGQDPDIRTTASNTTIANLSIATNHGVKDSQGNWTDATEWHRATVFGKAAEAAAQYLSKGSMVYIEGRLQTRKWQDQSGQDRYTTEIVANELQFVGGQGDGQQQPQQMASQQTQQQPQQNDPWGTPAPQPQQMPNQQPQQQPQQQMTAQQQQQQWQQQATRGNP